MRRAADHVLATVARLPAAMAQHDDVVAAGLLLCGCKRAAGKRLDTERGEQVCRRQHTRHANRRPARFRKRRINGAHHGQGREGMRLLGDLAVLEGGEGALLAPGHGGGEANNSIRFRIGPRVEQQRTHQAEHRRVHADAEREGEQADDREAGGFEQRANSAHGRRKAGDASGVGKTPNRPGDQTCPGRHATSINRSRPGRNRRSPDSITGAGSPGSTPTVDV